MKLFWFRLSLSYKDVGGTVHNVSSSFYPSEEYKPLEESGELALAYEPVPDEGLYMFNISLQGLQYLSSFVCCSFHYVSSHTAPDEPSFL